MKIFLPILDIFLQGLFYLLSLVGTGYEKEQLENQAEREETTIYQTVSFTRREKRMVVDSYSRAFHLPDDLVCLILYFAYDNPVKYREKKLPEDLSGQDLSGFDFTGCQFTHTDLRGSNLDGVILTNTTCDYKEAFSHQMNNHEKRRNHIVLGYGSKLSQDLQSIALFYPTLQESADKAKLLHIVSGFFNLPFTEDALFYIKLDYWYCELLRLKNKLGALHGSRLVCSLESDFKEYDKDYDWQSEYPQDKVTIAHQAPHDNFGQYLQDFTDGLTKYQAKSKDKSASLYYKEKISWNIKGLQATYPDIKDQKLQQEACNIAHALSKSYQVKGRTFLYHYLFYQNKLVWLQSLVGQKAKKQISHSRRKY